MQITQRTVVLVENHLMLVSGILNFNQQKFFLYTSTFLTLLMKHKNPGSIEPHVHQQKNMHDMFHCPQRNRIDRLFIRTVDWILF